MRPRYGMSPLAIDTWYHVAGVYDAPAQTLDVYLNGELDNGFYAADVHGLRKEPRVSLPSAATIAARRSGGATGLLLIQNAAPCRPWNAKLFSGDYSLAS